MTPLGAQLWPLYDGNRLTWRGGGEERLEYDSEDHAHRGCPSLRDQNSPHPEPKVLTNPATKVSIS
jgi:hypothetical protein